uniref:Uncharacterized protein n=1 Tax=Candidatus Kentrum eta TaxID=2126337 RepID=A0A450V946_9GAMM|nr:MAG: hypothetical protein BECKH772A_GA0070896_100698 [Candidatus Kentron sp. H]VFJ94808.1 MAG: hypothetical protein BECKH772B_GA0070898_100678 [Candidatus Kentron sp. H]VFK01290.1 MAG: hypothetical protein BECKH772C_GA0070978_100628 [Candidatus Kentron sp. H]
MRASSDPMHDAHDEYYEKYKDDDFADARPVSETPVLKKLQAGEKSRIRTRSQWADRKFESSQPISVTPTANTMPSHGFK